MAKKLDPIISEFDTQEDADAYDKWFREKVQAGIDDPRPRVPHDEVMARLDEVIRAAAARKRAEAAASDVTSASGKLDPLISEFETQEQADSYDRWFRVKVEKSLADPRPSIPHDEAMARVSEAIRRAAKRTA